MYAQIRFASEAMKPNTLAVHRLREDGNTGCGDLLRPWKGQAAVLVPVKSPANCPNSIGLCGRNGCFPSDR